MGKVFNALKKAGQETAADRDASTVRAAEDPVREKSVGRGAVPDERVVAPVQDVQEAPVSHAAAAAIVTSPAPETAADQVQDTPPAHRTAPPVEEAAPVRPLPPPPAAKERKATAPPRRRLPAKKAVPLNMERSDWDERLTLATAVTGSVAESFRVLRTRILHPDSGRRIKNVLVTSAVPQEGKSFVCANLGISFAQGLDHRALLVDCDLRKPSLGRIFGLPGDRGLVNYLRDKEELKNLITEVGVEHLRVIPAGPPPVNPSELLGSETMQRLIGELGSRYEDRIVIFDSPPLNSAAETVILAKQADAVVLVVRWGASRREHVKTLVEQIGKEKVVGVIFNAYRSTIIDDKVFGSYEYQNNYYHSDE